jgi:enediyne biosynthesis protein E4
MTAVRIFLFAIIVVGASGCGGNPVQATKSTAKPHDVEVAAAPKAPPAPIQLSDVAAELGVNVVAVSGMNAEKYFPTANGTGVGMVDFDLDGWMDVFVCQGCPLFVKSEKTPCSLLQSRRGSAFRDVASLAGVALRGYTPGVSAADVNGDGFPDLHLTRVNEPFRFFVNNGDGTMTDHSVGSGLNRVGWGTSAAWLDYDNDGNPDLYVVNYGIWNSEWHEKHANLCRAGPMRGGMAPRAYCGPPDLCPQPHFLFRSLGDGRFEETAKTAGVYREGWPEEDAKSQQNPNRKYLSGGRGQGVVACDLNNDCLVDLYVANDLNENFTFLNVGGGKFRDITVDSLANKSATGVDQAGMGVDANDYDGDGLPDLFVTNFYLEYSTLYRNFTEAPHGQVLFEDVAERSGVASKSKYYVKWGTSFEDLDGDGWSDLLVVNGHVDDNRVEAGQQQPYLQEPTVWRNTGTGRYERLTEGLTPFFSKAFNSRGAAFGDLFNDGQVHVVVSHRDQPLSILRNTSRSVRQKPYAWTQVQLVGTRSSRDAVGARIEIHLKDRVLVRHTRGGRSYLSAHDPRITTGLGDAESIEKFVVFWPSGLRQEVPKPAINQSHVISEQF